MTWPAEPLWIQGLHTAPSARPEVGAYASSSRRPGTAVGPEPSKIRPADKFPWVLAAVAQILASLAAGPWHGVHLVSGGGREPGGSVLESCHESMAPALESQ